MLLLMKRHALAEEAQLIASKKRRRSPATNLPREDAAEHLDRQQEAGTRRDPARVVRRKAATRHHTMDVRMWSERLSPGVQNG